MKLEKAIEILTTNADSITEQDDLDFEEAQKMAVEALKRIKLGRSSRLVQFDVLLPGETKD